MGLIYDDGEPAIPVIVAYVVQYEGKLLDCGDDFTVSIQNMISDCDVCPYSPRQFKSEEIRNEPVELSLIGTFSQVSLYPDVWMAQIGDDEAHSGKQFSWCHSTLETTLRATFQLWA